MKKILLPILLLITGIYIYAEEPQFIINSGHTSEISSMDYFKDENLLFTGGQDGTVKIWNSYSGQLKYNYQISHMPVRCIEVCQTKPYIASVISDGINAVNLTVHNWKTGELVFRHRLAEVPLFIRFSPLGSFVMYGKTDFDSLVFLDAETGNPLNLITEGFGIVSSAFISESEKTLLAYNNSGSIQYWDLTNNTRKTKIPSIPNLKNISFTSNGRYMTGYDGKELLLIDLLKGNDIDSIPVENLQQAVIDFNRDKLVWTSTTAREMSVNTVTITGTGFTNIDRSLTRSFSEPSALLSYSDKIFTGYRNGTVSVKDSWSDDIETFSENVLLDIQDFAVNNNSLSITAEGKILSISSELFQLNSYGADISELGSTVIDTDPQSVYGLSSGEGSDFLLWESDSPSEGTIRKFNSRTGMMNTLTELSTPLISAEYKNGNLLTLDKNGECRVIDYLSGEELFNYTSFGLRAVDFIDGNNIIAGRNSTATLPSPLLHINTKTGETVPVDDNNILVFDLEYDELTRKLYTLGFEERNGIMRTVLKQHTGRNHDRAETILAFPGEDINASFTSDSESSKIFTSLGYGGIKMLYWGGFTQLETGQSIPMVLKLHEQVLSALNHNSSLSIYNTSNGSKLMDVYIFRDLSWAAILDGGRFYASSGAEKYVNIYDSDTGRSLQKNKYIIN